MRHLYTIFLYIALPLIRFRLWRRSRRLPGYGERLAERFGYVSPIDARLSTIWVHAVSLGEVMAAIPLLEAMMQSSPHQSIWVTTTTLTGSDQVRLYFGDRVRHSYFPYDLPVIWRRFFKGTHPGLLILMETELWPNCLLMAKKYNIPVFIANARLSEPSLRGYRRLGKWFRQLCSTIAGVAAQSEEDAQRFCHLGVAPHHVSVTGNIKFDLDIPESMKAEARQLRTAWGNPIIWIAASTHEGEEALILQAFKILKARHPRMILLLVPRHPERFIKVFCLCESYGFQVVRRSLGEAPGPSTDIILGDTLGELRLLYGVSDIAFVGGSLVPMGGHNMIEAAAFHLPIMVGPYTINFRAVVRLLKAAEALMMVYDVPTLVQTIRGWLDNPASRTAIAERAYQVNQENTGALARTLNSIEVIKARHFSDLD